MTGERLGYARVSTTDQNTSVQEQQLEDAGCSKVACTRPGLRRGADEPTN